MQNGISICKHMTMIYMISTDGMEILHLSPTPYKQTINQGTADDIDSNYGSGRVVDKINAAICRVCIELSLSLSNDQSDMRLQWKRSLYGFEWVK